jgi:cytoskeletal protein CcmA (bactofilin family)
MAQPFFGRRETETPGMRPGNPNLGNSMNASPLASSSPLNQGNSTGSSVGSAGSQGFSASAPKEGGSKLTVGPNIKLKGVEITDCDTLVVEGMVEATMNSRVIQIAERGSFKGAAEIDIAEIYGQFDGNLTVRQKLVIYATGKVTGTIRYGKVVIEEGGQISGDISFSAASSQGGVRAPGTGPGMSSPASSVAANSANQAKSGLHVAN